MNGAMNGNIAKTVPQVATIAITSVSFNQMKTKIWKKMQRPPESSVKKSEYPR